MTPREQALEHVLQLCFKALQRAIATPTASPWLPIESAPRDGSRVLMWSDSDDGAHTGYYNGHYWQIAWWDIGHDGNREVFKPTFWQPITEPPKENENG